MGAAASLIGVAGGAAEGGDGILARVANECGGAAHEERLV